jgi:hypothetical protein
LSSSQIFVSKNINGKWCELLMRQLSWIFLKLIDMIQERRRSWKTVHLNSDVHEFESA